MMELTGRDRRGEPADLWVSAGAAALTAVAVALVAAMLDHLTMDAVSGALTLVALSLVAIPVLGWVARREGDPRLSRMLLWALAAKVAFTLVRYFVIAVVYGDNADAGVYSEGGAQLAEQLRQGILNLDIPVLDSRGTETKRIGIVVGLVYLFTGVSRYAASFVFAYISFAGQVLMWRAFRRAVPEGDHHRYALLVLFLPSLLFWPSSIGKEALMVGCIGVVSYGAAQVLGERVRLTGVATFLAGVAGLFLIRPHMALIAVVSLGFASAVGTLAGFRRTSSSRVFVVRMVALVALVAAAVAATSGLSRFFSEGGARDEQGVSSVLARTTEQTRQGGSEFAPPAVSNPAEFPAGVVTVLFRPFPWEARNFNGLIASGEGILLLALFAVGHRRLRTWVRAAPTRPYLVFAAAYALVFIVAFSYIGNFGILARQRTQMLPLLLTVVSMYPAPRTRTFWRGLGPARRRDGAKPPTAPLDGPADLVPFPDPGGAQ